MLKVDKYRIMKNPFVDYHKYRIEKKEPVYSGPFWNRKFTGKYEYKTVVGYIGARKIELCFNTLGGAKAWIRKEVRAKRAKEYGFRPLKKKGRR